MALIHGAHPQLLRAVLDINKHQRRQIIVKMRTLLDGLRDRKIGMLGLSFKPNTDDMREAPSVDIARQLVREGALVQAYDPVSMAEAAHELPDVRLVESAYEAAEGVDALMVVTEWNEFRHLSMERIKENMAGDVLIDGRNIYNPDQMTRLGFRYAGVGRGPQHSTDG
jgi:UDPglucose 6-dehydrogenase